MHYISSFLFAAAFLLAASPCAGEETFEQKAIRTYPDKDVEAMLKLALQNIDKARCEDDKPCAPPTQEELAHPPLSVVEARRIMIQGSTSALAEFCGLDFKRSFVPMMTYYRRQQKMNERSLAIVAMVHGISQGRLASALKREEAKCSDEMRAKFDETLPKLPQ
jgi:hypothetical protein